jgi:hypothetical protein
MQGRVNAPNGRRFQTPLPQLGHESAHVLGREHLQTDVAELRHQVHTRTGSHTKSEDLMAKQGQGAGKFQRRGPGGVRLKLSTEERNAQKRLWREQNLEARRTYEREYMRAYRARKKAELGEAG